MKVLHINCNYIGTALHRVMFRRLDRNGEQRVFVPSDGREAWKGFQPEQDETVAVCFRRWDRYLYFKKQAQIRAALEKIYDVRGFDCLHAHTLFTDGNCAMKLSEKYGIPYVVAVRNTDLNGFFRRRWLLRGRGVRILREAAAVVFLSEEYRRQLLERYIPRRLWDMVTEKSHILPNGIDPFWLENPAPPRGEEALRRIREGRVNVIFAGRINRYKNLTCTAAALTELNRRGYDFHFTAVGPVEEPRILEQLRTMDGFTYVPPQPKEKLLAYYRANDLYVMPSYDETFGLVYPEAMSQGLPVLYARGSGFFGQLPEGEAGYAADPDDPHDVAEKILRLVEEYEEIAPRCPALARRFDWDDITARYEALYEEIVGGMTR